MINFEQQLQIQAFLDGELPAAGALEIAALIARNPEAAALHAELKNTRRALAGAEPGITLPESREFYWSKLRRDLERLEPPSLPAAPSIWQWFGRLLKPAVAVAAVVVLGSLMFRQTGGLNGGSDLFIASSDMDAITFRNDADGTSYVWFTDAAENDVTNDEDDITLD